MRRNINSEQILSLRQIESIMTSHPKQKVPGPHGFTGEFYQMGVKEEIIPVLTMSEESSRGKTYNLSQEAYITLISKTAKTLPKKQNYRSISLMNIDVKIHNKILANCIFKCIKIIIHHKQV